MVSARFRQHLTACLLVGLLSLVPCPAAVAGEPVAARPNILFCIADDWGWPHAGALGEPVVATPTFDRLCREGVLFEHAYVSSPSCTPSRSAILTGQDHWRLEEAANLWSTLQARFRTYPEILGDAGYHVGSYRKAWGPGRLPPGGRDPRTGRPAGPRFLGLAEFLDARPDGAPFCFWFGSSDPHRPYEKGSGAERGMDLQQIRVPPFFPDAPEVRGDLADYFFEVERFDREVGEALAELERRGELENTLVVMTGDHGMPFPRCKGNLYDSGARVPLAMRWGGRIEPGRRVEDFVSLVDLAPTFVEIAGLEPDGEMTGSSLGAILHSPASGRIDPSRDAVIAGRERHTPAQAAPSTVGYPSRSIRTHEYLYIRNYAPDRWPAGVPEGSTKGWVFADCDAGPTRQYLLDHQQDPGVRSHFARAFEPRPEQELYVLALDPEQLENVAADPTHSAVLERLGRRLDRLLERTADPRSVGGAERFDSYPYYGRLEKRN